MGTFKIDVKTVYDAPGTAPIFNKKMFNYTHKKFWNIGYALIYNNSRETVRN